MAENEKIRTEDVIEISDTKVRASRSYEELGVIPGETYNSVISKIQSQTLTADQKDAFDNTLTNPSASNPVVLVNDLQVYVPEADLGEIKDSVNTFDDLPVEVTPTGDTTEGFDTITNISDMNSVVEGQNVEGPGIPDNAVVIDIAPSAAQINQDATATGTGVTIRFFPSEGELRAVLADAIIYRWNGSEWDAFIRTGTLDHTELINQNRDTNFQHLTETEKDTLLTQTHTHENKSVLDEILTAGSGAIITSDERAQLPSVDEKAALAGTSGTPADDNRYVTDQDPRLETVRNPYVTVGPPGSLATFEGVDFRPFEDAVTAITVGTASAVKAIETLPGEYDIGGVVLKWDTQDDALLFEAYTPGSVELSFQQFQAGLQLIGPGTGNVTIRGLRILLNDFQTSGVLSTREDFLIEDCVFTPGPSTAANQVGITIQGDNSIIRRCQFLGELASGVIIEANDCRIEECVFDLDDVSKTAIEITGNGNMIDHCFIRTGTVMVNASSELTQIMQNIFSYPNGIISDTGVSTRYLENQPQLINQPFVGAIRAVGPDGTYADYLGSDETPFLEALADNNTTEVLVLSGTYNFSSSVVVPEGKSVRGDSDALVSIIGADGTTVFTLEEAATLSDLAILGSGADLVTITGNSTFIERCSFTVNDAFYAISTSGTVETRIRANTFSGEQGVHLDGTLRTRLFFNTFTNNGLELQMESNCSTDQIKSNFFNSSVEPVIQGNQLIIEANHFSTIVPTKLGTTDSVWSSNWPHPDANNLSGVDTIAISSDAFLDPLDEASISLSILAGVGTLRYADSDEPGTATTLPISIPGKVDQNRGYEVVLYWNTQDGLTGDVIWQVQVVYRDGDQGLIGSAVIQAGVSSRTGATAQEEDSITFTFTNAQYGLPVAANPTHISFTVQRISNDQQDNLAGGAHLLELEVTIPRD